MDELFKKLEQLEALIKRFIPKTVQPSPLPELPKIKEIKPISAPSMTPPKPSTKMPGMAPPSKKNPRKVAEQIKNGQVRAEAMASLKRSNNDQWSLAKDDSTKTQEESPAVAQSFLHNSNNVSSKLHGFGYNHHNAEQNALIHGVDTQKTKPIGKGVAGAHWAKSSSHPHDVVLKRSSQHPNFFERGHDKLSSSKREVLFHNMADKFFGLGKHVPLTAGFSKDADEWSVQKRVPDVTHVKIAEGTSRIEDAAHAHGLAKLSQNGDLHKLALMDHIMGHHDRHGGNFMMDGKGDIHLNDNGTSFDYGNFDQREIPAYVDIAQDHLGAKRQLHPEAKKWLMSLDSKKARQIFADHSYPQDAEHVKGFVDRLESLKNFINENPHIKDISPILVNHRKISGPQPDHHGKKAA
jgi:hypothetical protein